MVAEKVKKTLRGDTNEVPDLTDELGDVLWYLANLADQRGLDLNQIANRNIQKLESRRKRNVIRGSGDNR